MIDSLINVAMELSSSLSEPKSASEHMEYSNWYYKQINKHDWHIPFPDKDIQFVKLFEQLNCSERERDIVYVSQFFPAAYNTLHVTILRLGETPSPGSIDELVRVYETLVRLGASRLLLNYKIGKLEFLNLIKELGGTDVRS